MTMEAETGIVWADVLPDLQGKGLVAVHGQCTQVGVAGFTLHGGVHFGGWSELYGLSADNLVGATVVLADGRAVHVQDDSSGCVLSLIPPEASAGEPEATSAQPRTKSLPACEPFMAALRGVGSAVGVVASVTLRVYTEPSLRSALSVISLDTSNATKAADALQKFMSSAPESASLTLFGLDAFFKAYFFIIGFARPVGKLPAAVAGLFHGGFSFSGSHQLHFVVEASWLVAPPLSLSQREDPTLTALRSLGGGHPADDDAAPLLTTVPFAQAKRMWSVPSYDLVWGRGHLYAGASMSVDSDSETSLLHALLSSANVYQAASRGGRDSLLCSDCVFVLHRMGAGIREAGADAPNSIHPSRRTSTLWAEMDCGLFHSHSRRRRTDGSTNWARCSAFVQETQDSMEDGSSPGNRFHYLNVPSPKSQNWKETYYSEEGLARLELLRREIDPGHMFRIPRVQSAGH
eukprot:CAMPEP_0185761472 /NCGR_PEP_ID=MMETSP1174-20130828/20417_1 /TAXON_ID=35687 /ORGANISM="Dictyocha speculum, Strain CCMP1381" /LENGTH=461 /DNA_ID=CAMNT_0028442735 /DNA_START=229 /DNA_END=1614 /DNA_ORIENTATION=+